MRLIASFFGGWDFGSFSRSEYILYILAALSMFIASISKSVRPIACKIRKSPFEKLRLVHIIPTPLRITVSVRTWTELQEGLFR